MIMPCIMFIETLQLRAKQVQMYDRSGTVDAVAKVPVIRFAVIHQVVALFCVKWCHGHHLENV